MGGVLILVGILVPTLLWADLTNRNIWILVLSTLAFGAVGFADDYIKVVKKRSLGLTARREARSASSRSGSRSGSRSTSSRRPTRRSTRRASRSRSSSSWCPTSGILYIVFAVLLLTLVEQRRQPHRRPRRPRDRHDADRRRRLHRPRLRHRPPRLLRLPRPAATAPGAGEVDGLLRGDGRARRWASCGGTATRPRSSWATWAASRSAARSARWPS